MTCPSVSSKPNALACNADRADRAPSSNVLEIKEQLNQLCGTPLRNDASWGTEEIARLKQFQRAEGLPATGEADAMTLERLTRRVHDGEETMVATHLEFGAKATVHSSSSELLHQVEHAALHQVLHQVEHAANHAAASAAENALEHGARPTLSGSSLRTVGTVARAAGTAMTLVEGAGRIMKAEDKTKETLKVVSGQIAEKTAGGAAATAATAACAPLLFVAPACGTVAYAVVGTGARYVAEGIVGGAYDAFNGAYAAPIEPRAFPDWNVQTSLMMNPAFNEGATSAKLISE